MLASNSQQLRRQVDLNKGELRRLTMHDAPTLIAARAFREANLRAQAQVHAAERTPEAAGRVYVLKRAADQEAALARSDRARLVGLGDDDDSGGLAFAGDLGDAESVLLDSDDEASPCSSYGGLDEDRLERRAERAERRSARVQAQQACTEPAFMEERTCEQPPPHACGPAADEAGPSAPIAAPMDVDNAAAVIALDDDASDDDGGAAEQPFAERLTPSQVLELPPKQQIARVSQYHASAPLFASAFHELERSAKIEPEGWLSDTTINFFCVLVQVCSHNIGLACSRKS